VKRLAQELGIQSKCAMNVGRKGLAPARNLGIRLGSGRYVAFVDDDIVLPRNWALSVINRFQSSDVIGVTGPAFPLWENGTIEWLPKEFYWLISCSEWFDVDRLIEVRSGQGMNMAFKREAFEMAGQFLEGTGYHKPIAEDLEFSLRVRRVTGKKIVCDPEAHVFHTVRKYRFSWRYVVARSHHIGVSRYITRKIHENGLDRERQLVRRMFRSLIPPRLYGIGGAANLMCLILVVFLSVSIGYLDAMIVSRVQTKMLLNEIRNASTNMTAV